MDDDISLVRIKALAAQPSTYDNHETGIVFRISCSLESSGILIHVYNKTYDYNNQHLIPWAVISDAIVDPLLFTRKNLIRDLEAKVLELQK